MTLNFWSPCIYSLGTRIACVPYCDYFMWCWGLTSDLTQSSELYSNVTSSERPSWAFNLEVWLPVSQEGRDPHHHFPSSPCLSPSGIVCSPWQQPRKTGPSCTSLSEGLLLVSFVFYQWKAFHYPTWKKQKNRRESCLRVLAWDRDSQSSWVPGYFSAEKSQGFLQVHQRACEES